MKQRKIGRIEEYQDKAGQWRWRIRAGNGLIVADGAEGYASRRNVRRAWMATFQVVADVVADLLKNKPGGK